MIRIVCRVIGIFFILLGVVLGVAPIPVGWLMMLVGLTFLIPTTPSVAKAIKGARCRSAMVNSVFTGITRRAPMPYRRILRETEVDDVGVWR